MKYNIKSENLKFLIKKYNIDIFSQLDREMTMEEINNAIESMDIFEKKNDSKIDNDVRKVAYLAVNSEYQKIQLEINNHELILNDNYSVIAALYNSQYIDNKNTISIEVKGEINDVINILIPNAETISDNIAKEYTITQFSWDNLENIVQNIWSDKEYILEHFSDYYWDDIVKLIDVKLWDDPDFISRIETIDIAIQYLPQDIKYNQAFLDVVIKDEQLLCKMFKYHYYPLFTNTAYENPIIALEQENKHAYSEDKHNVIIKAKKIKEQLDKLIENKEVVINLLKVNRDIKIYNLCSEQLKYDVDVLKALFYMETKDQIEQYLPIDVFKNEVVLEEYIKTKFVNCKNIKNYPFIYKDWINDKDKLMKYLQLVPKMHSNPFEELFKLLPKILKNDKDVLSFFISKTYRLYENLSEPYRMSKKLLFSYIESGKPYNNANYVPTYALQYLDKEEQIYVLENIPSLILKDDFPSELKNDLDIISSCGKIFNYLSLTEEQIEQLSNDTEKAIKLIYVQPENFKLLNNHIKKNSDIVIALIEKIHDNQYMLQQYEPLIPNNLWCSKRFCINIIKRVFSDNFLIGKIPKNFWNDKQFIEEIAQAVDDKDINIEVFNHGPKVINEYLTVNKIKQGNVKNSLIKLMSQSELANRLEEKMPNKEKHNKKHKI